MAEFNLSKIRKMRLYPNLFDTDQDYMKEICSLPKVELERDALYVLNIKKEILFTQKLRYMRSFLENEVNRQVNNAIDLIEDSGSDFVAKYVVNKVVRESIVSLIHDTSKELSIIDTDDTAWHNLLSGHARFTPQEKAKMELVVFCHLLMAELTRCWFELQDRYVYVIGDDGLYDVSLFYTSFFNRSPDLELELNRSSKYDNVKKQLKKKRTDCCFIYDNEDYFTIAIQGFTNKLKKYGYIEDTVDLKAMETIFSGRPCHVTIKWLKDIPVLKMIIKKLTEGEHPVIKPWPANETKWWVVECRFVDKDGKSVGNIRSETPRKKQESIVDEVTNALSGLLPPN